MKSLRLSGLALFAALVSCASTQRAAVDSQPRTDPSAIVVRFESAGNLLDALRTRVPTMTVTYPGNDCPRIMFRGRQSGRNQGNPSVYVDGTLMQNTCILAQMSAADVEHVELFPSGNTSRAGIQRNPFGLILVFRVQ